MTMDDENKRPVDVDQIATLALAYVGDAVYDQYVRTALVLENPGLGAHGLHKRATRIVCAAAQARTLRAIMADLTPQEIRVFKRGRNAHAATVPKNADVGEYRVATGFEAVLGHAYLRGDTRRLNEILSLAREKGWEEHIHGEDKP
jgi:ribonuclease-3 family protein